RSASTQNNDLGWRGFLIAQFVLLLLAADHLPETLQRAWRAPGERGNFLILSALFALGFAGVIYDLAIGRFYPILSDTRLVPKIDWLGADEQLGLRTLANREAYDWLRHRTASTSIVQQNPNPVFQDTFYG